MASNGNGDDIPPAGGGDLLVPDLQTMKELCQPTLNGRGGPIASISIQAMNFGLKKDMIQQVQNSCQFHGLSGDDANKHLDKFLHLRNEITNFHQCPDESLFEAWERYKLSIDRCPNHNMLPVTQIDTFYNWLTLRHNDTINVAEGGNFMKSRFGECYDLIENMTANHNDWDTSVQRRFNQNENRSNPNQNYQNMNQGNNRGNVQGNNHRRNQFFQGANHGQNPPPAYQASAYQASGYQAPVQQAPIPQPRVVTTTEFTNYMKANDVILKNIQTNMTSLKNSNLELKNMFGQFMKMNTASSLCSETLLSNTITNMKEDLKGITTQSGIAYKGPTIPTTSSPPKVVEHETEVTKDTVAPTN
nr:hypothetical protein [Tanacetum cinerariifolium]